MTTVTPLERHRQGGPPLIVPAAVATLLTVVSVALGAAGPRITDSAADVLSYDLGHHTLLVVLGTILFGISIPLAVWSGAVYRRLRQLGITAPGTAIGLAGGLIASASLGISGLVTWAAGESATAGSPGVARALTDLAFATGGAGFVVPLGLLIAGVAIPSLILRFVPRPLALAGLVIGALGMLATFSLVFPVLDPLLPIGRFGGLVWLCVVSVLLPHSRARRNQSQQAPVEQTMTNA
ncbi:MAG TPA: DUF4386 domain-containing protein [Pseudonocardiaceae bacterium]|jgi:hypothetical protein|nr:DUF4386 domain-containing protein [Pseudonocardiaceae bacterium]